MAADQSVKPTPTKAAGSDPPTTIFTFSPINIPQPFGHFANPVEQQINERLATCLFCQNSPPPAAQPAYREPSQPEAHENYSKEVSEDIAQPPPSATLVPALPAATDGTVTITVVKNTTALPKTYSEVRNELESFLQAAIEEAPPPEITAALRNPTSTLGLPVFVPCARASRRKVFTRSSKASTSGQFTSEFRGVSRHRLSGRYEAHFWDATYQREPRFHSNGRQIGRTKGRQVYVGSYLEEVDAARAYDKASIAYLGPIASLNFPLAEYSAFLNELIQNNADPEDVVCELRRSSKSKLGPIKRKPRSKSRIAGDKGREEEEEVDEYDFGPARPKRIARGKKNKREDELKDGSDNEDEEENLPSEKEDGSDGDGRGEEEEEGGEGGEKEDGREIEMDEEAFPQQQQDLHPRRSSCLNEPPKVVVPPPPPAPQQQQQQGDSTTGRAGSRRHKSRKTDFLDSVVVGTDKKNTNPNNSASPNQYYPYHQPYQQQNPGPWWQQLMQPPPPPPSVYQARRDGAFSPYQPIHTQTRHPHSLPQAYPSQYPSAGLPKAPLSTAMAGPVPPPIALFQGNNMISPEVWTQWNAIMQGNNVAQVMPYSGPMPSSYQQRQQPLMRAKQYGGGAGAPAFYPPTHFQPMQTQQYQKMMQHYLQQQQQQQQQPRRSEDEAGKADDSAGQNPRYTTPTRGNTQPLQLNNNISPFTSPIRPAQQPNSVGRTEGFRLCLSPLAAGLLSPLGFNSEEKWKVTPLDRMLNSQDPSMLRLLNSMHRGGAVPAPAGAKEEVVKGNEDLWGTLQWLESLDTNKLASGGARRGSLPGGPS